MSYRWKNGGQLNRSNIGNDVSPQVWIKGCTQWMEEGVLRGCKLYYVNIMFGPLRLPQSQIIPCMKKAIEKFYGRFCTEFSRDPRAPSQQDKLPQFWLFPDLPVFKYQKHSLRDVTINGNGLHYNGPNAIATGITV